MLKDYDRGFFQCLNHLSPTKPMSFKDFANYFYLTKGRNKVIFVCVDNNKVIGTAAMMIEPKFSRGGSFAGHIEDVVVLPEYRGQNIASTLIEELRGVAEAYGCYRITLECDPTVSALYEKCGFTNNGMSMRIDL